MGLTPDRSADLAASLPRPLQLLIAAAQPSSLEQVEITTSDWDDLPSAAQRHGLSGLLPTAASRFNAPPAVREQAGLVARDSAIAGLKGIAEVIDISRVLRDAGLRSVSLKGPTLARWLYGRVGFRRSADLDIMVAPRDVTAAYQALAHHGYRLPQGMSVRTAQAIYKGLGAWPLTHADRYPVDLHFRLCHVSFGSPLLPEAVIADSRELDGVPGVLIPSASHAALMLLVHASKHLWCTLEMVLAIARVTERTDVDWLRVQTLARRSGTWSGCAAGLALASEIFGVTVPDGISTHVHLRGRDELRGAARSALLKPAGVFADRWEERRAHRAALDRWSRRMRYDVCRLVSPTPLERAWYQLPDSLTSLYLPLRLTRLTVSAARGVLRHANPAVGREAPPAPPGDVARPSTRGAPASRRMSG